MLLFEILNIFFDIIIIVLFIRYFVEKYQFYGYGPVLDSIMRITNAIMRPLLLRAPRSNVLFREHMPLAAILVVVLIRGAAMWLLGAAHPLAVMLSARSLTGLPYAVGISLGMAVCLAAEMTIAFLFASLMISKRGMHLAPNAGVACFQERTYAIFQFAKRFVPSNNIVVLFLSASFAILLAAGAVSALVSLAFAKGAAALVGAMIITCFQILQQLVWIYMILLLVAIIISWVGADPFSVMAQVLRAMTDPYLNVFRRLLPWARIDFIDLSPIAAFILLYPVTSGLLTMIQAGLLSAVIPMQAAAPSVTPQLPTV